MNERHTIRYVNQMLRGSYNPFGIRRWWARPRAQLGGLTPRVMWRLDKERVVRLAEEGQGQVAT